MIVWKCIVLIATCWLAPPDDSNGEVKTNTLAMVVVDNSEVNPRSPTVWVKEIRPDAIMVQDPFGNVRKVGRSDVLPFSLARKHFDNRIQAKAIDDIAFHGRALATWSENKREAAMGDVNEAIRLKPDCSEYYVTRGDFQTNSKRHDQALIDFDKAIELNPKNYLALTSRAIAYQGLAKHDQAIADLSRVIAVYPKFKYGFRARAESFRSKKEYDRAIEDYSSAIAIDPNYKECLLDRGTSWSQIGQLNNAISDYSIVLKFEPRCFVAILNRGSALCKMEQFDAAQIDLSIAIEIDSRQPVAFLNRGLCFEKQNSPDRAIMDFTQAINLSPNDPISLVHRGRLYYSTKQYFKAMDDWTKALEFDPQCWGAKQYLAWLWSTCPSEFCRNGGKAVEYARQLNMESKHRNWVHMLTLAVALAETGSFEQAEEKSEQALKLADSPVAKDKCLEAIRAIRDKKPIRIE